MKTKVLGMLLWVGCVASASNAPTVNQPRSGRISVTFINPDSFTDIGLYRNSTSRERAGTLRELGAAMQNSSAKYLRDDFRLDVQVKDVDLAGNFEWWRESGLDRVRVVRDLYPPRMKIEFRLSDQRGRVLRQGEAKLGDPNFLFGATPYDTDLLRHDKALFRNWLRTEFAQFRK